MPDEKPQERPAEKNGETSDTIVLTREGAVEFISKWLARFKVRTNLLSILVLMGVAVYCSRLISSGVDRVNKWEKTLNKVASECVSVGDHSDWELQLKSSNTNLHVPSIEKIHKKRRGEDKENEYDSLGETSQKHPVTAVMARGTE